MGDLAGAAGFFLPYPVVQTEGLVMDPPFLQKIHHQGRSVSSVAPIRRALLTSPRWITRRTRVASITVEPIRGVPTSARMRAVFCELPVLQYDVSYWRTRIYDLDALPH